MLTDSPPSSSSSHKGRWLVLLMVTFLAVVALIVVAHSGNKQGGNHSPSLSSVTPRMKLPSVMLMNDPTDLSQHAPDEYIVFNANIYTMATVVNTGPLSAMAVRNGRVLEASNNVEDLIDRYEISELFDAAQRTIIPGLIDAHTHLTSEGLALSRVNLMYAESVDECIDRIKQYIIDFDIQIGDYIQGRGWDHERFPGQNWPTKEDLDQEFPDNPIYLGRVDGHAGWANSAAMALATIPDEDPEGGEIQRDANGEPTGIFIDTAQGIVSSHAPSPTIEQRKLAAQLGSEKAVSLGITGVHDAGTSDTDIDLIKELIDENNFDLRFYSMLSGTSGAAQRRWCTGINPDPQIFDYGDGHLTVRSVKISMDGALGSRGAAMLEEYSDDPGNYGLLRMEAAQFQQIVELWANCDYQVNTHAIGDRANRVVLDVYERVMGEVPTFRKLRNRVEHAQILTADDVPRFRELGVLPSVQPTHCTSDMRYAVDRLGPERARYGYVWQTFFDQGVVVPMGSDFPVEEVDPMLGLYSAVSRQDFDGFPEGGFYPDERVSIYDAVRGFTSMAAYGAHQENQVGSLEPGKRADFIFLDKDIMAEADNDFKMLLNTTVVATVVGGDCAYHDRTVQLCIV